MPPTLTARPRCWRSGSCRRSCRQQRRRWTRTLSPLAVVFRPIAGGRDLVVPDSSSLSNSDSLVVLDSSLSNSDRLVVLDSSSNCDSMVMLDSSSLSSSSGNTVVSGNRSSAGSEVSTTTNLPGSSSSNNMRGLVGLETLDEGGISRNLLRHQERLW